MRPTHKDYKHSLDYVMSQLDYTEDEAKSLLQTSPDFEETKKLVALVKEIHETYSHGEIDMGEREEKESNFRETSSGEVGCPLCKDGILFWDEEIQGVCCDKCAEQFYDKDLIQQVKGSFEKRSTPGEDFIKCPLCGKYDEGALYWNDEVEQVYCDLCQRQIHDKKLIEKVKKLYYEQKKNSATSSVKIFFREIEDAWNFIKGVLDGGEIAILLSDLPILVEVENISPLVQSLMKKYKCRLWDDFLKYLGKVSSDKKASTKPQRAQSVLIAPDGVHIDEIIVLPERIEIELPSGKKIRIDDVIKLLAEKNEQHANIETEANFRETSSLKNANFINSLKKLAQDLEKDLAAAGYKDLAELADSLVEEISKSSFSDETDSQKIQQALESFSERLGDLFENVVKSVKELDDALKER